MTSPTILWLRRDLRLSDHPALDAAIRRGGPIIPVFIYEETVAQMGAAPKWRLGLSLRDLAQRFEDIGSRLILRKGDPLKVIPSLVDETGAGAVHWSRLYDPTSITQSKALKTALKENGIAAESHNSHLLFEPWTTQTKTGGFYRVYTPFWRAVKDRSVERALEAPKSLSAPDQWPSSDPLESWALGQAMQRGATVCLPYQNVGEENARSQLRDFIEGAINTYDTDRNLPALPGTSGLSENLTYGEISTRQCWHAGMYARHEGMRGAETWLKELVWREFAYHLMYHTPHILSENWRQEWGAFPWNEDENRSEVIAWKQGRTGVPFVDAAMREMYVTGKMHNRGRMIAASYLTKHLMCHWRIGLDWFAECLTDWDPASNAMGWQWSAGSGPDATPYFRIFNAETQLDKFDKAHAYPDRWIAEGRTQPTKTALSFFDAIPRSWGLDPKAAYPSPIVGMAEGRQRALAAYEDREF